MIFPIWFGPVKNLVEGLIDGTGCVTLVVSVVGGGGVGGEEEPSEAVCVLVTVTVEGDWADGVDVTVDSCVTVERIVDVVVEKLAALWRYTGTSVV